PFLPANGEQSETARRKVPQYLRLLVTFCQGCNKLASHRTQRHADMAMTESIEYVRTAAGRPDDGERIRQSRPQAHPSPGNRWQAAERGTNSPLYLFKALLGGLRVVGREFHRTCRPQSTSQRSHIVAKLRPVDRTRDRRFVKVELDVVATVRNKRNVITSLPRQLCGMGARSQHGTAGCYELIA